MKIIEGDVFKIDSIKGERVYGICFPYYVKVTKNRFLVFRDGPTKELIMRLPVLNKIVASVLSCMGTRHTYLGTYNVEGRYREYRSFPIGYDWRVSYCKETILESIDRLKRDLYTDGLHEKIFLLPYFDFLMDQEILDSLPDNVYIVKGKGVNYG